MDRNRPGVVNAYILNQMVHSDTVILNIDQISQRITKRFHVPKHHLPRPRDIRIYHLDKLVERRWLRKSNTSNGEIVYERIGELKRVRPAETLHDQFTGNFGYVENGEWHDIGDDELSALIEYLEQNRFEDYEANLTESEYDSYVNALTKEYEDYVRTREEFEKIDKEMLDL